jgi:hypothetical protein
MTSRGMVAISLRSSTRLTGDAILAATMIERMVAFDGTEFALIPDVISDVFAELAALCESSSRKLELAAWSEQSCAAN